ncbi:MAG TPA: alpha/beta hydrolase, partial [Clostridia bacterium]|nr:alpha/beta hydrolase [Clostridia bacterium]
YLSAAMASNPNIRNPGYNTLRDLFSEEYGLLDKINYVRGILNTYNRVYPQLYDVDLRLDHPRLQVPVYFFEGRYDLNAPVDLVVSYAETLEAPAKEIVWFEHSGHNPWINESDRFVRELLQRAPR